MPFDTIPGPWGCWGAAGPPLGRGYGPLPGRGQSPFVWGYFVSRESPFASREPPMGPGFSRQTICGSFTGNTPAFHVKFTGKELFFTGNNLCFPVKKRQIVSREKKFLSREPRSSFHVKLSYPTCEKYGFVSRESRELVGVVQTLTKPYQKQTKKPYLFQLF